MKKLDRLVVPGTFIVALGLILLSTVSPVLRPATPIRLVMHFGPPGLVPHRPYGLSFTPRNRLSGHILTDLVSSQRPCIAVTITNDSLTYLDRHWACRTSTGSYRLRYAFPAADDYVLFVPMQPIGGPPVLWRQWVPLDLCALRGRAWAQQHPCHLHPARLRGQEAIRSIPITGTTVTAVLGAPAHALTAQVLSTLTVVFLHNGRAVTDLQALYGAAGEAVAVSIDTQHLTTLYADPGQVVHGRVVGGAVSFSGRFDVPSIYRVFATFRYHDRPVHATFVVDVDPAPTPTAGTD